MFCFLQKSKNALLYYYLAGFSLILIAGLRSEDICRDYTEYRRYYEGIKNVGNIFFIEPTFVLFTIITPRIEWLMLIYAVLGVSITLVGIRRLTKFYFLSLLIYFSAYFILHEMTQIRVGVATGLFLLCIEPIYNRKILKFTLITIIAASFHYSALIIFPLYFFRPNKINLILYFTIIPIAYLLHIFGIHFTSLIYLIPAGEAVHQKLMIHQLAMSSAEEIPQINVYNIIQLLRIILIYILLWKATLLQKSNKYFIVLIKIYILSVTSFVLFADIPVLSFRISELMGVAEIILLPMILYILKPQLIATILSILYAFGSLYMLIIYGKMLKPYFG